MLYGAFTPKRKPISVGLTDAVTVASPKRTNAKRAAVRCVGLGLLPEPETVEQVRRAEWREAVEACRLVTSPAYHLLRAWHGLPPLPYLGQQLAYIRDDPNLAYV